MYFPADGPLGKVYSPYVSVGVLVPVQYGQPKFPGWVTRLNSTWPLGPRAGSVPPGVGAVVADVDGSGLLVDGHPERVAETHRVDLGAGVRGAGAEEVARRDGVAAVGRGLYLQQLAAQVVGVAGGPLGVELRVAVRAFVDGGVAGRLEGVGVVAGGEVEVPGGVEVDVSADVAALAPVARDFQDDLLAGDVEGAVGLEDEAGEVQVPFPRLEVGGGAGGGGVTGRGVQDRRVVEVDEAVRREPRVDGDALEAFLVVGVDGELPGGPRRPGRRRSAGPCRRGRCAARTGPAARPATWPRPVRQRRGRVVPAGSRRRGCRPRCAGRGPRGRRRGPVPRRGRRAWPRAVRRARWRIWTTVGVRVTWSFLPDGTWGPSGKALSRFATYGSRRAGRTACGVQACDDCAGARGAGSFFLGESAPTPPVRKLFACWQRKINLSRSCQNCG